MPGPRGAGATARQRTAAQRKSKEDDVPAEEVVVQDSEEQAAEIRELRKRNDAANERAQNGLDIGVIVVLFITGANFLHQLEHPSLLSLLSGLQTLLLPLSLTPYYLPLFRPFTESYHTYLAFVHLILFVPAFLQVKSAVPLSELVRWALPELMVGAVEIQRRNERDSEAKLRQLEGLQYDVKGA
ncbi:hypothetical protein JCM24511_03114 [Saitozyma sp. JCM 24511]|nr:hypothetical protein JCM24511_03114 [Saitozyma sp. JCM 24511]